MTVSADEKSRTWPRYLTAGLIVLAGTWSLSASAQSIPEPQPQQQSVPRFDPQPRPEQSTFGVNGYNLHRVDFARGWFERGANGVWTEFSADGRPAFSFRETGRDEWSVYLLDDSRNMPLQLDVHRKMISISGQGDLYPIVSAKRLAAETYSQDGVNGRNLHRADFARGWFERGANGVWTEFSADGRPAFSFRETGRDEWSVYLLDDGRNMPLQLDVHRKMISISGRGDLYPIVSAKRLASGTQTHEGVNGSNLNRVTLQGGVSWVDNRNGTWTEYDADGVARFSFTESGRDDWSVYLFDDTRNLRLQLDVHRKMILSTMNDGAITEQWPMARAERRN